MTLKGRRGITCQVWRPGLKYPVVVVLISSREELALGGLFEGQELKPVWRVPTMSIELVTMKEF